jgi:amidohydrolase
MRTKADMKQRVCESIDRRRVQIKAIGDQILSCPELGFKEFQTAKLVASTMQEFGVRHKIGLGITGVKGVLPGKRPGPTVALLGELDALHIDGHPDTDAETHAAHGCGHNAQIAGLLGAMMGLVDTNVAEKLAGTVVFFAVPAEENIEINFRSDLVKQGKLGFIAGKQELLRLGHFDDIDIALIIHTHSETDYKKTALLESCNGCVIKKIRFTGAAAHAGSAPHMAINALNSAQLALGAINAQRETFRERDTIRVHPIITKGGASVNVVPAEVCIETYVRGKTNAAILDAEAKVDRALRAGAMALGATVEINTIPGYMPLNNNQGLGVIFRSNSMALFGDGEFTEAGHDAGSTNMGDISQLMPVLHPSIGGATGAYHSAEWRITDKELAYIGKAKALALMAVDLLWGDAQEAKTVLASYEPPMTKMEYLELQNSRFRMEIYNGETGKSERR